MPSITVRFDDLNNKLSDGSSNQLYKFFWIAAVQDLLRNSNGRHLESANDGRRNWRVRLSNNLNRATISGVDQGELPGLTRLREIHQLTGGEYTIAGLHLFIGVTDARFGNPIQIMRPSTNPATPQAQDPTPVNDLPASVRQIILDPNNAPRKWDSFTSGTNYTFERIELNGTMRNWFSSHALSQNGISIEQYISLDAAQGTVIRTPEQFQAIRPVTPIN